MKDSYNYYAISTLGYEWEGSYNVKGGGWESVILEIDDGKKGLINYRFPYLNHVLKKELN